MMPLKTGPLRAYCSSHQCAGPTSYVEKKNVKMSDVFCPACGHALFFTRMPESPDTDKFIEQRKERARWT